MRNGLMLYVFVASNLFFSYTKANVDDSLAIDSLFTEPLDEVILDSPIVDIEYMPDVLLSDSTDYDDEENMEEDIEEGDDLDFVIEEDIFDDIQDTIQVEETIEDLNIEETNVVAEELDLEQLYTNINMLDKKYFEWLTGSIRDLKGETIHGKLKYYNKYKSCRKVKFVNVHGEQKVYRAKKLEGYTRENEHFDTRKVKALMFGSKRYVKVLLSEGGVSLYRYYYRSRYFMFPFPLPLPYLGLRGDRFATGGHSYYATYVRYYIEKGEGIKKLGQRKYKKHLVELFPNCGETTQNVKDKYFMYGDHDMINIVKEYLHCVE